VDEIIVHLSDDVKLEKRWRKDGNNGGHHGFSRRQQFYINQAKDNLTKAAAVGTMSIKAFLNL
jgi:hypothetical protein